MESAKIFFIISLITGSAAFLFCIFAWIAGTDGTFIGKSQLGWFIDAGVFFMVAIWMGTLARS